MSSGNNGRNFVTYKWHWQTIKQYVSPTGELNLHGKSLTALPKIPESVKILDCGLNELTSLQTLPTRLERLKCSGNKLSALPSLPDTLQELDCHFNIKLTSLPKLPYSLVSLNCSDCKINALPELPRSLEYLICFQNKFSSLPPLPETLKELNCGTNTLTELPTLPHGLIRLTCFSENLRTLPILPSTLQILDIRNTHVHVLPPLPPGLVILEASNTLLNELPDLPRTLQIITLPRGFFGFSFLKEPYETYYKEYLRNNNMPEFIEKVNEYNRQKQSLKNLESLKVAGNALTHTPFNPLHPSMESSTVMNFISGIPRGSINERILQLREKLSRLPGAAGIGGRRKGHRKSKKRSRITRQIKVKRRKTVRR
jgi:hypothetical protein